MSPILVFAVGLSVFFLIRYVLLAGLRSRLAKSEASISLAAIGTVGALEAAGSLALMLTISAALVCAVLFGLETWFQSSRSALKIETIDQILGVIRSIQSTLHDIHLGVIGYAVAACGAGVLYLGWRERRAKFESIVARERSAQMKALIEDLEAGRLPPLAPTEQMTSIAKSIAELDTLLEQKQQEQQQSADPALAQIIEAASEHRAQYIHAFIYLDLSRRISVEIAPQAIDYSPPRGLMGSVGGFFISRGLLAASSVAGRATLVVALLLAMPAGLVVVGGAPGAQAHLATSLDDIEGFRISLATKNASETFAREIDAAVAEAKPASPEQAQAEPESDIASRDWCTESTTACDTLVTNRLAMAFEQAYANGIAEKIGLDRTRSGVKAGLKAGSPRTQIFHAITREASLRSSPRAQFVQPILAPSPSADGPPAANQRASRGVSDLTRTIAADHLAGLDPARDSPVRAELRRFVTEELIAKRPTTWTALKLQLAAHAEFFKALPTRAEMFHGLVLRAASLTVAAGGIDADFERTLSRAWTKPHQSSIEIQSRAFIGEILKSGNPETASNLVREGRLTHSGFRFKEIGELHSIASRIAMQAEEATRFMDTRPATLARLSEGVEPERVTASLKKAGITRTASTMNIGGYRDTFPPPEPGAAGPRSPGPGPQGRPGGAAAAYEFKAMHASPKVGGVVFGRPSENPGHVLDFKNLTWRASRDSITLSMMRADGHAIDLGPFNRQVVHQSLAYVADGRLVPATVLNTSPLKDQKVTIHPAFLDTPLGCRVLTLDFYVFDLTAKDEQVRRAMSQVHALSALYKLAWIERLEGALAIVETLDLQPDLKKDWIGNIKGSIAFGKQEPVEAEAARVLPDLDTDLVFSFLDSKTDYFDAQIGSTMRQCTAAGRQLDDWRLCMRASAEPLVRRARQTAIVNDGDVLSITGLQSGRSLKGKLAAKTSTLDPETMLKAMTPPPEYAFVSGVRELPWTLDSDLSFARPNPASAAAEPPPLGPTSPLEFFIQAAFTSPPYFRQGMEKWWSRDPKPNLNAAHDTAPWQFPTIAMNVRRAVASIRDEPLRQDEFRPVEELVRVQRLFRAALEGRLGPDFPLHKLALLAKDTASSVRESPTPRWKPRPGRLEIEFLSNLRIWLSGQNAANLSATTLQKRDTCLGIAEGDATQREHLDPEKEGDPGAVALSRIPHDVWHARCVFTAEELEGFPQKADLANYTERTAGLREVRETAGAVAEDGQPLLGPAGSAVCSPM